MQTPPRALQSYLALALLALLALGLPVVRGGVDAPTLVVEVVVTVAAAILALWCFPEVPLPALLLAGVLCLQLLQLVPVPAALHAGSAVAVRVFATSLEPVGLYPSPRPFSLDPASSAGRFAEGLACLAVYLAAWSFSRSRQRFQLLCAAVGASGALTAVLVLGAALLGVGPLFEPRFPFVNPNHLAAFTNLCTFVGLGLALHSRGPERLLWLVAFVVTSAVGVLSLSRAGLGAFLFGAVLFVVLYARRGRRDRARGWAFASIGLGVGAALGVAAYLASDSILAELRTVTGVMEEAKPHLWSTGLALLRGSPWLGIGRGAFGTVIAAYKTDTVAVTYTHVENEWLQPFVDLGVPGGLLLVGTLLWVWLSAARRTDQSALRIGLLVGVAAVAVHDLADFSLEIPGVAIPFFACLGALGSESPVYSVRRASMTALAGLSGLAALGGIGVYVAGQRLAVNAPKLTADETVAAARLDLWWHPADYLPHAAAGAALAGEDRCNEAWPWLARAMLLNPTDGVAHRYAGRCLWSANRSAVAATEFRLAIAYGETEALDDAILRYTVLPDLLAAVPDTPDDRMRLAVALQDARPSDAAEVLQRLMDDDLDARALVSLARVRLQLQQFEEALALAHRVMEASPGDAQGYLVSYSSLLGLGRVPEAEQVLLEGSRMRPGNAELLTVLSQRAIQSRRYTEAKRLAEQIVPRSAVEASHRELLVANALTAQGRIPEAIARAQAAASEQPQNPEPLLVLGGLFRALGRYDEAIDVLERAAKLPGADSARCQDQIAGLRREAADSAVRSNAESRPP
jgi:tetratricopeptide (TPR) repeat protein/O-antigen ligase